LKNNNIPEIVCQHVIAQTHGAILASNSKMPQKTHLQSLRLDDDGVACHQGWNHPARDRNVGEIP
jgi:hypothetical protein